MMNGPLVVKSKELALDVIKLCNYVRNNKHEYALADQLIRSGTSIGANIREANYAASQADFVNKLQIALKECYETEYWLELMIEGGYWDDRAILEKCIEVKKILIASAKTAKAKANA